jgi:hypothetical protein
MASKERPLLKTHFASAWTVSKIRNMLPGYGSTSATERSARVFALEVCLYNIVFSMLSFNAFPGRF